MRKNDGGAAGGGGDGGLGGPGGIYGGNGGIGAASDAGGGGGGAGLGGAVFAKVGAVTIVNCTFTSNLATNGLGGYGSFGIGNGQNGQGVGGALLSAGSYLNLQNNAFTGNAASSIGPDVYAVPMFTPLLSAPLVLSDGNVSCSFTNSSGVAFSVYASTNLSQWTFLGSPTEASAGQYQFTDLAATNYPERFYRVVWP